MTYEMPSLDVANLIISFWKMVEKSQLYIFFSFWKINVKLNFATKKSSVLIETCLEIQTLITCLFFSNLKSSKLKHVLKTLPRF